MVRGCDTDSVKRVGRWRSVAGLTAAATAIVVMALVLTWGGGDELPTKVASSGASTGGTSSGESEGETDAGYPEVRALLERTGRDGTRIAVVSLRWHDTAAEENGSGEWVPPPPCRPIGDLEIGLAGEQQTAMGYAPEFPRDDDRSVMVGAGLVGHPTLGPFYFAAVRTAADVQSARLLIGDDAVDITEPEDGWAFLAVQLEPRSGEGDVAPPKDVAVEVTTDDGSQRVPKGDRSQDAECQPPPPSLPSHAQPASDADAEAVTAAYTTTFAPQESDAPKDLRRLVSGGDALDDELLERTRELGENYADSDIRAEVHKVGIVDADSAVVVFRLRGALGWMLGDAELVDGRWLVSGQTFCHLINVSDLQCPATMWDDSTGPSAHD